MLPSSSSSSTQFEYCEKIANEVFKYEVLMKKTVKTNYESQRKLKDAYQELAKTFYLTNAMSGYKLLEHLVKFCLELICTKIRENAYQCEYGVLSACPTWVRALDKPLGLMQIVYKQYRKSTKARLATCLFSYELLAAIRRAIDNSTCEARHLLLLRRQSLRSYALSLGLPLTSIFNLWKKMYKVSILKLDYLLEAGDVMDIVPKSTQLSKIEKNILDLGLLYDVKVRVVKKASFLIEEKLNPMILLYKLMVAAKEKYFAHVYRDSGSVENNAMYYENLSTSNVETVEMWALVYLEYLRRGLDASFVLLQKRWYEMKSITRRLLHPSAPRTRVPHILLIAMTKRFPYIISDELPSWFELGNNGQIYSDSDISALSDEWKQMQLNVKENINVNDILEELCEESQENVQVIETDMDAIDVDNDSDSDANNCENEIEIQENLIKTEINRSLAKKLGSSGVNIKTTVIIDDDFDIDKELKMFKLKQDNSVPTSPSEEPVQNMDTDTNGTLNVKESGDSNVDGEQNNGDTDKVNDFLIDKKLLQMPIVVLTPVDKTSLWQKYSRDNAIKCESDNTQNLSMTQYNNEKSNPNTKTVEKKAIATEDKDLRKKLQNKRKFLMRHLKLSKTSYSKEFWSERNINLLEQCKLVSVTLNNVTRVAKKVELADIDEIRRINKTILTAQVAPMTQTQRKERKETSSIEKQQNQVAKGNAKEMEISVNEETNNMFKKIVVKRYTSNPINNGIYKTRTTEEEIEWLNSNINKHICKLLDMFVNRDCKLPMRNRKPNNKRFVWYEKKEGEKIPKEDIAFNSIDEWKRQKNFTRKYFDLKPVSDVNNVENKKDEHNNEQKQNLTATKQYDSDDSILVIDEDIKIEDNPCNKVTKPLEDMADVSIKTEIKEINNGVKDKSNGKTIDSFGTHKVKTEIKNEVSEISNIMSIDGEMFGKHKVKTEINNEISEISNGVSMNSEMFGKKVKTEINNEVSEISNGISKDSETFGKHKVKIEHNYEVPITNEIFVSNEIFKANNGKSDINNDKSINNGINKTNPGISNDNINNEINKTDLDMSNDTDMDLIVISSDDDDDVKPIINDTTKSNNNTIKSRNNGNSAPRIVKIIPSLPNPTIDTKHHNVINMLSKVAYNIKSNVPLKNRPVISYKITESGKTQNLIKNDSSIIQLPGKSPNTTYYLIKVPSEAPPSNSFPMPVIQSVESLSTEEKVVITKTNQSQPPIVYNDLLKRDENPECLRSLLTNTSLINNLKIKQIIPTKVDHVNVKPSLVNKKKIKILRNTNQNIKNTDKKKLYK